MTTSDGSVPVTRGEARSRTGLGGARRRAPGPPRGPAALVAVLGLALLTLAAPAAGQAPDELVARGAEAGADAELLRAVRARAGRAGLDAAATAGLLRPAVGAAEAGLPTDLLLEKALEGLSKGVPAGRLSGVLTGLGEALERAASVVDPALARPAVRDALAARSAGGGARAGLVESAALGLSRGAGEEAIRAVLDRLPSAAGARGPVDPIGLGVAFEVLADLPVASRSPDLAARLVIEALASGFEPTELRELPAALEASRRRGQLPAEAAARGAMAWMRSDLPATAVLQNLFAGEFPGRAPFDVPPGLDDARDRADRPGPPDAGPP